MTPEEKMVPMTLTIDRGRQVRLKETSAKTRIAMSEIVRISLDRLWEDLGDLNNPTPEAASILFNNDGVATGVLGKGSKEKRSSKTGRK